MITVKMYIYIYKVGRNGYWFTLLTSFVTVPSGELVHGKFLENLR